MEKLIVNQMRLSFTSWHDPHRSFLESREIAVSRVQEYGGQHMITVYTY